MDLLKTFSSAAESLQHTVASELQKQTDVLSQEFDRCASSASASQPSTPAASERAPAGADSGHGFRGMRFGGFSPVAALNALAEMPFPGSDDSSPPIAPGPWSATAASADVSRRLPVGASDGVQPPQALFQDDHSVAVAELAPSAALVAAVEQGVDADGGAADPVALDAGAAEGVALAELADAEEVMVRPSGTEAACSAASEGVATGATQLDATDRLRRDLQAAQEEVGRLASECARLERHAIGVENAARRRDAEQREERYIYTYIFIYKCNAPSGKRLFKSGLTLTR